jgi:AraC-like DNA-binding protein
VKIYKEITPLSEQDVFVILDSDQVGFNYPIHSHSANELTLVLNSSGNRIVGDSVEKYFDHDLVLIGSNVYHKWDDDDVPMQMKNKAHVVTIQFSDSRLNSSLFDKKAFSEIRKMLFNARRGIVFHGKTKKKVTDKVLELIDKEPFDGAMKFFKILQLLATTKESNILASEQYECVADDNKYTINKIFKYITENFTKNKLSIIELANAFNMSPSSFGHYFKRRTQKSFTQFVIDLRLGYASRLLLYSDLSISDIAYDSGYNNLANFNRLFKKNKGMTPFAFRKKMRNSDDFYWKNQITPNQFIPADQLSNKVMDFPIY